MYYIIYSEVKILDPFSYINIVINDICIREEGLKKERKKSVEFSTSSNSEMWKIPHFFFFFF